MICALTDCGSDAIIEVQFTHRAVTYGYCEAHATRWKKVDGAWKQVLAWTSGVETITPITPRSTV